VTVTVTRLDAPVPSLTVSVTCVAPTGKSAWGVAVSAGVKVMP
jgi:hypothetical protein